LFVDVMGIPEHVLFELAREGAHKIACPACATTMTECFARGVQVDLCRGCGASWLDGGELTRLARDIVDEVKVASRAQPAGQQFRFHVLCVNCDQPLNLSTTNWLINTRPWCPTCAKPYAGLLGMVDATSVMTALINFVTGMFVGQSVAGQSTELDGRWAKQPDVLRVVPADADKYFGSFFTRVRSR
jgi:Zn-finger nucleic acid-binding protein